MMPALVVVRIGRYAWVPFPFLLFWPLLALLWLASLVRYLVKNGSRAQSTLAAIGAVPALCVAVNGTRVAVDRAEGPSIRVVIV
ncbi:MAG: hypothetical protein MUE60_13375 [Candidatus Eisenbacteria bacterium]|jgi:hypothetical protein|nr:hypothetical protein [Candidatus Eisenbacteria bacterium]